MSLKKGPMWSRATRVCQLQTEWYLVYIFRAWQKVEPNGSSVGCQRFAERKAATIADNAGTSIHNLKEMKSRLDDIDHTILQVKTTVDDATTISSSFGQDASSIAAYMMDSTKCPVRHHKSNDSPSHAATLQLVNDQYYGTSSIASLFTEIEGLLEARLADRQNATGTEGLKIPPEAMQECQLALRNMAKTLLYHDSLDLPGEDLPPTLPPQRVLEATIELYFSQVSSMLPVFRKSTLCERFRRIYSTGPNQADIAWVICFNNLILQTLSIDNIQGSNLSEGNHVPLGESPERELLPPLLTNYQRGLKKLDRLLKPVLVNVQALLLMVSILFQQHRWVVCPNTYAVRDRPRKFPLSACIPSSQPSMLRCKVHGTPPTEHDCFRPHK